MEDTKLAWLTPRRVQEWKKSFLVKAKPDPVSQQSAQGVRQQLPAPGSQFVQRQDYQTPLDSGSHTPLRFRRCGFRAPPVPGVPVHSSMWKG